MWIGPPGHKLVRLALVNTVMLKCHLDKNTCSSLILKISSGSHIILFTWLVWVVLSLSSPLCYHLLWGRVDVLCGPPCLRGAGQDGSPRLQGRTLSRGQLFICVRCSPAETCPQPGHLTSCHQQIFHPLTSIRLCLWSPALLLPPVPVEQAVVRRLINLGISEAAVLLICHRIQVGSKMGIRV